MLNSLTQFSNAKFGYYCAVTTTVLTVITFGIAICTPPLSGPFCQGACLQYPYTDSMNRFPRDYFWMYPAIILSFSYLAMMLSIHQITRIEKKLYSMISVSFAVMSALVLSVDYFIQVSVIPPSLLAGETDGLALISQFNPHGIFIVLEELGFLFMMFSFFVLLPVFSGTNSLEKAIRWTVILGCACTIVSFILISLLYGINREYRFEIAVISIVWIELIVLGILFTRHFKRLEQNSKISF